MRFDEVVAGYYGEAGEGRSVWAYPDAEEVSSRIPDVAVLEAQAAEGSTSGPAGRVLVDLAPIGDEAARIERRGRELGPHDVLVLAVAVKPSDLPVGPVVQAACAAGLRVVQAEALRHAQGAHTVLVLTGDHRVPQRSYLLGEPLPESERTRLRQANEWAVEGLQVRALLATTQHALEAARAECDGLRGERDALQAQVAEQEAQHQQLRARLESADRANRLLRAEAERRPTRMARKAAGLLREDPVGGAKRLARAAARRARR